ncbi:hypothetical protein SAMN06265350_10538 [Solitalea koreensis]|uniref:Uncharacterized protein n=1 Tax=Solitalea koreensis TaxID=543615 RepID=A0A521D0M1_9SPHI|nr:hypothetical protein SAMN06265350_10538 [Solitalea koreensis]
MNEIQTLLNLGNLSVLFHVVFLTTYIFLFLLILFKHGIVQLTTLYQP